MTKRQSRQNRKGFQLVELIIVISILSIVVAVSIPAYRDFTTRTRNDVTRVALAQFRSGIDRLETSRILSGTGDINNPPRLNWNEGGLIDDSEHDAFYTSKGWPVTPKIIPNGDNPENPWMVRKVCTPERPEQADWVYALGNPAQGTVYTGTHTYCNYGWVYNIATGQIWANSNVNGENAF